MENGLIIKKNQDDLKSKNQKSKYEFVLEKIFPEEIGQA